MLITDEINRLIKKEFDILADEDVVKEAEEWTLAWKVSPQMIGLIYSYMKHKYEPGATLHDMERVLGVANESISFALRELEAHGYLTISRASKPFLYRVTK